MLKCHIQGCTQSHVDNMECGFVPLAQQDCLVSENETARRLACVLQISFLGKILVPCQLQQQQRELWIRRWRRCQRYSTVVGHVNGKMLTHIQWYDLLYMKRNISLSIFFLRNLFQTVTAKPGYRPNCHLCVKRIRQKRSNETPDTKNKNMQTSTLFIKTWANVTLLRILYMTCSHCNCTQQRWQ